MTSDEFNPGLLLLARQYRQYNQAEVARRAGMNQGHYSRIENGLVADGPSLDSVERIARALEFPFEFFYQEDGLAGLPLSVHPMNRKKSSIGERALKQIHASLNMRLFHLRRYLLAADLEPELPCPNIDVDEGGGPQGVARTIRQTWLIGDGPIKNLTDYCERAGIIVAWCDFDAQVDGVTMNVRDLPPCIFLNTRVPADRMRYSLAHELGHVIMHRIPTDEIENEANAFASELLVPDREFKRSLLGQRLTLGWLARQKAYWRVSMASLLYKAGTLDLITRHQSEYLWKQISARGWRTREPQETDFPPERPSVFPDLVRLHTERLGYDVEELADLLLFAKGDIRQIYGSYLGKDRLYAIN